MLAAQAYLDILNRMLRKISRRYLFEILAAVGFLFVLALVTTLFTPYQAQKQYTFFDAKPNTTAYHKAEVISLSKDSIEARLKDGPAKESLVNIPVNDWTQVKSIQPGATIVLSESNSTGKMTFFDQYRIPTLVFLIGLFIVVVLLVGRKKGLMSLAGLSAGIIVIGWVIIPLVIAGYNSLLVAVFGAYIIAIASILIAHGLNRRTFISLLCILIVLVFVTIGSQIAVSILGLTGLVDDSSYFLQLNSPNIDMSGILVGGIVIAALGALDDIVTTQVATVDELKKAKKSLTINELYRKALSVGGEHIAALVNTLALVYIGASLPLILAYSVASPELFTILNSQFAAIEITRTVIVSIGLVISVPVSTFVAAVILSKKKLRS